LYLNIVYYEGKLYPDGTAFDSSFNRQQRQNVLYLRLGKGKKTHKHKNKNKYILNKQLF